MRVRTPNGATVDVGDLPGLIAHHAGAVARGGSKGATYAHARTLADYATALAAHLSPAHARTLAPRAYPDGTPQPDSCNYPAAPCHCTHCGAGRLYTGPDYCQHRHAPAACPHCGAAPGVPCYEPAAPYVGD